MKKTLTIFIIFLTILCNAQIVNIPDANFKAKLLAASTSNSTAKNLSGAYFKIDANSNSEIEVSEALRVSSLQVSYSISNLTGIESFTNITQLYCNDNQLTSLNLYNNTALQYLNCSSNNILNLNFSANTALQYLDCSSNYASNLNVSNNTALTTLICNQNNLTSLNVNSNRALIQLTCYYNVLTSLNVSSNTALTNLHCSNNQLTSLNISSNTALNQLNCAINQLTSLNLNNASALTTLNCYNNQLTSLNVSSNTALSQLYCYNNLLTSLNVSANIALTQLHCYFNQLTSLNVSSNIALTSLICSNNQLTSLNVSSNTALAQLNCANNQLTSLNLSSGPALTTLNCYYNLLTSLNASYNTGLTELNCYNNQLTSLNINNDSSLTKFYCYNNQLTSLNVSSNTLLIWLYCYNNQITSLDVSKNQNLQYLNCYNNQLTRLLIKNGINENINFGNNPNLRFVCGDVGQLASLQSLINLYTYGNICALNNYCSFTPGGTFYTINGNNKFDSNTNGCDALDIPFPNFKIKFTNGTYSDVLVPDNSGNYNYSLQGGTQTITPILENPTHFNVSPTTATVTFPATASPATRNFCITPNGIHPDLEIAFLPITRARPGFDAIYKIVYKNKGNQTMSGNITVQFPDNTTDFVSAAPVVNTQNVGNLIWNYANLLPFESRSITFTLNLNTPMETPPLNAGSLIGFSGTITPIIGDEYLNDNSFALRQLVVNSFDPNDKTCLEGNTLEPAKVGDFVHYMIRFQNDGTAAAQNIVVKDMIDTAKFDIATLIPVDGSHSFTTKISNTNQVEFIFENINLPFATGTNQGYVAFKIKTKSTLVLGNTFSNLANIYFDYNFPIITNNYTTTIAALSNQDFEFSKYFSLYPNPAKENLNIEVKNDIEISSISVYNMLGQLVLVNTSSDKTIDVSGLKTGNYFVKISTDKGTANSRFVKD